MFGCFQFPSQIEFWKQFLFSTHFGLPNKFFSLNNRKLFLKIENRGTKQLPKIPKSLFYKVFKAKYFPNGSIFDAKASSGLFAWKSILWARKFISMGARWRIGDGSNIKIFENRWLPDAGVEKNFHQVLTFQEMLRWMHLLMETRQHGIFNLLRKPFYLLT